MVDSLTVLAMVSSLAALFGVVYLISVFRKGVPIQNQTTDISRLSGAMDMMNSNLNSVVSKISKIESSSDRVTDGIDSIRNFTELFKGSSQKRGQVGEIMIKHYLEALPREMWGYQVTIPGTTGRVDYVIRINNNGKQVLLPIDSKFSMPEEEEFVVSANKKALKRAQEIGQYIVHGVTTDFAVMVLPNYVYYSLTSETITQLKEQNILPAPVDGVMILCSLALRAHQAVDLQHSTAQLRDFAQTIQTDLKSMLYQIS